MDLLPGQRVLSATPTCWVLCLEGHGFSFGSGSYWVPTGKGALHGRLRVCLGEGRLCVLPTCYFWFPPMMVGCFFGPYYVSGSRIDQKTNLAGEKRSVTPPDPPPFLFADRTLIERREIDGSDASCPALADWLTHVTSLFFI